MKPLLFIVTTIFVYDLIKKIKSMFNHAYIVIKIDQQLRDISLSITYIL